jgi:hypothetical protein
MFEDVKPVIRTRTPREYNGLKKKDNRIKNDIRHHYTLSKEVIRFNKLQIDKQHNSKKKKDKHITQTINDLATRTPL